MLFIAKAYVLHILSQYHFLQTMTSLENDQFLHEHYFDWEVTIKQASIFLLTKDSKQLTKHWSFGHQILLTNSSRIYYCSINFRNIDQKQIKKCVQKLENDLKPPESLFKKTV